MATATWPASLPEPEREGFTHTLGNGSVRTEMDAGPAKTRRRFTATVDKVRASVFVTGTERQTLRSFYKTTLKEGSLTFEWEDRITGTTEEYRFVSPPRFRLMGHDNYMAEMELEILP